jgi:hypothetical protein
VDVIAPVIVDDSASPPMSAITITGPITTAPRMTMLRARIVDQPAVARMTMQRRPA